MTAEDGERLGLVKPDSKQERFQNEIKKWADGEAPYSEVMKGYPEYTVDEKIRHALRKWFPNVF